VLHKIAFDAAILLRLTRKTIISINTKPISNQNDSRRQNKI